MTICDICGAKLDASEWHGYYEICPRFQQSVFTPDDAYRLLADRDFCPDCWGKVVDYIEEQANERRNQMR